MGGCSCTQPRSPRVSRPTRRAKFDKGPSKVRDIEHATTVGGASENTEGKQETLPRISEESVLEQPLLGEEPLLDEPLLSSDATEERKKKIPIVKYAIGLTVVALLGCVVYAQWGRIKSWAEAVWHNLLGLGLWAVPIWVLLLFVTTSVSGPAFFFELNGGVLFDQMYGPRKGAIIGMLTCCLGVWLGCVTAFAIGRRFFKQQVEEIIKDNRTLRIINEIITEEGWKFSFLMRLNPMIPFEIFNYAVAMTDISFAENAIATIGTLPRVCFEVYLAAAASEVAEDTGMGESRNEKMKSMAINLGIGLLLIAATAIYGKMKYDAKVKLESSVSDIDPLSVIRIYSTTAVLPGRLRNSIGKTLELDNLPRELSKQFSKRLSIKDAPG